ncbi:hypothetical protein PMIT1323_00006 [Prochlorococcus marinus str. MIT 1323]|nr:hypothetical protein PMIT1323_00006 [Prochlorococcus marinus str. MIT 1323]
MLGILLLIFLTNHLLNRFLAQRRKVQASLLFSCEQQLMERITEQDQGTARKA